MRLLVSQMLQFEDIFAGSSNDPGGSSQRGPHRSLTQGCSGFGASASAWASPWIKSSAVWLPLQDRFQALQLVSQWRVQRR